MKKRFKSFVLSHSIVLSCIYYYFMNNKVRGIKGNEFKKQNVFLKRMRLSFFGEGNKVIIGGEEKPSYFRDMHIEIHGNNHQVIIEHGVSAGALAIYCADNNCSVHVKEGTSIAGKTELATMEGTSIIVGRDCLFSANITLRAGDSHSVIDAESGARLNASKDIHIGNHVWIGNTVILTKGTVIGDNSVVATGSVVAGKVFPANSAIGGNPAKVIKEDINWIAQKI